VEANLDTGALRYLTAECVDTPIGRLTDVTVVSPTGDRLGDLDGIIIDPAERRAPYMVVSRRRLLKTHRYLLPLMPSRIVHHDSAVQLQVERRDLRSVPEIPSSGITSFSDDDLITAMFSTRPA
jgi:hypothetical protein